MYNQVLYEPQSVTPISSYKNKNFKNRDTTSQISPSTPQQSNSGNNSIYTPSYSSKRHQKYVPFKNHSYQVNCPPNIISPFQGDMPSPDTPANPCTYVPYSRDYKTYNNYMGQIPNRIFVGGVPQLTSEDDLKFVFNQFGLVKDVRLIFDKSSNLKGYGFVTFENADIVNTILQEHDHITFRGKQLNISSAFRKAKTINNYLLCETTNNSSDEKRLDANQELPNTNPAQLPYGNSVTSPSEPFGFANNEYNNMFYNGLYGGYYPYGLYYQPTPQYSFNDIAQYMQSLSNSMSSTPVSWSTDKNDSNKFNNSHASSFFMSPQNIGSSTGVISPPAFPAPTIMEHPAQSECLVPLDMYKNVLMTSPPMYGYWYGVPPPTTFAPVTMAINNSFPLSKPIMSMPCIENSATRKPLQVVCKESNLSFGTSNNGIEFNESEKKMHETNIKT
jgi:RNA recognition motif-containing protein